MSKFYSLVALAAASLLSATASAELPAYTVVPAQSQKVEELKIIEVTFDGEVELTDGCYVNTSADPVEGGNSALSPRYDYEGCTYQNVFTNERFEVINGNTLYLEAYMPVSPDHNAVGSPWITVLIKGGSYSVNGEPGEDILLRWNFAGMSELPQYWVEPEDGSYLPEIQVIDVTFDGEVELTEGCYINMASYPVYVGNSELSPRYDYEGCTYQNVFTNELFEVRDGDTLHLESYMPASPDHNAVGSDWITILIKGGSYSVNGLPGEDILITYFFTEEEEDAVERFFAGEAELNVVDMQGRQILKSAKAADLKGLKGLYVVNGRKVVLK